MSTEKEPRGDYRNTKLGSLFKDNDPFKGMTIQDSDFLNDLEGRAPCPKCKKSRKYFCYQCYIVIDAIKDKVPQVELPIQISIVKHPGETDGKSTGIHAPILDPKNVKIYNHPEIPDTEKSILVFPSDDAEDLVTFFQRMKRENNDQFPYKNVIFVESTWNQTFRITHDPRLIDLPKVKLATHETVFWRYQRNNPVTNMSTIEAIYYFCRDYHEAFVNPEYNGEFDNLLFFFKFFFYKIRGIYGPESLLAYANRPSLKGVLNNPETEEGKNDDNKPQSSDSSK